MQQHLRHPLMRELSAALTEGENSAPNDPHTHIHCRNFGQHPNCKSWPPLDLWRSSHWSAVHLILPVAAYSVLRRQVQWLILPWHNKSLQYSFRLLFAFGNVPDGFVKSHTAVSVPKGSYFPQSFCRRDVLFVVGVHVLSLCQKSKIFDRGRLGCGAKPHLMHYTERCIEVRSS